MADESLLSSAAAPATATEHLPRRLGVPALVLIIVAFNAPIATMAGFAQLSVGFGNGVGAPVSFLIAAAILLIFSVGFVGMSRYIDNPGAFYRFIVTGLGRPAGLLGAFLATAAYLLLCAGSYPYLGLIIVDQTARLTGSPVLSWQAWSLIFLVVITALGLMRIDLSMKVLGTLVCLEIAVVAIWEVAVLLRGGPEGYTATSFTPAGFLAGSPGLGVLFAMLCMIGIEAGACFRAETRNPEKAVGRATYTAIAFMGVFYAIGVWCYVMTQGASKAVDNAVNDPVGSFFNSVHDFLGVFFLDVVAIILITSQMAAINAIQGAASRYLFDLGRDRVLPQVLGRVHRRLESPYVAVLVVAGFSLVVILAIWASGLDAVKSYAALTGGGIYFLLPLLIVTSVAVIVFYRRHPELPANTWTRLVAPALAAVSLVVLLVLTSLNLSVLVATQASAYGVMLAVVVVAASGYLLALHYRKRKPAVYATIGAD